jgi:hypothetical protein
MILDKYPVIPINVAWSKALTGLNPSKSIPNKERISYLSPTILYLQDWAMQNEDLEWMPEDHTGVNFVITRVS